MEPRLDPETSAYRVKSIVEAARQRSTIVDAVWQKRFVDEKRFKMAYEYDATSATIGKYNYSTRLGRAIPQLDRDGRVILNLAHSDTDLVATVNHEMIHAEQYAAIYDTYNGFYPYVALYDYLSTSVLQECHAYCGEIEGPFLSDIKNDRQVTVETNMTLASAFKVPGSSMYMLAETYFKTLAGRRLFEFSKPDINKILKRAKKEVDKNGEGILMLARENFSKQFFNDKKSPSNYFFKHYFENGLDVYAHSDASKVFSKRTIPFQTELKKEARCLSILGQDFLSHETWRGVLGHDNMVDMVADWAQRFGKKEAYNALLKKPS